MQDKPEIDAKALNDTELIALLRKTQDEIAAYGESNELHLLVRDFARELLKRRLLAKVKFVHVLESSRPE